MSWDVIASSLSIEPTHSLTPIAFSLFISLPPITLPQRLLLSLLTDPAAKCELLRKAIPRQGALQSAQRANARADAAAAARREDSGAGSAGAAALPPPPQLRPVMMSPADRDGQDDIEIVEAEDDGVFTPPSVEAAVTVAIKKAALAAAPARKVAQLRPKSLTVAATKLEIAQHQLFAKRRGVGVQIERRRGFGRG